MRFSWSKFNRVIKYILIFLHKLQSFGILNSLIAITSKFLFREQEFMWNKETEFGSIFIFWISSIKISTVI